MSDGLMSGPLEGQRVLITGASVGIGAAIARDLSAAGCVVGLCARRADLLQTVADSCGPHARHWAVDLSNLDAIEAVSYTHLRAHETGRNLVCRLLLEK